MHFPAFPDTAFLRLFYGRHHRRSPGPHAGENPAPKIDYFAAFSSATSRPHSFTLLLLLSNHFFFFFLSYFLIYLFIFFWLCWVFVSVQGLSLVAASGGPSSWRCTGLSLSRPLLLQSTGSRRTGSVVVAHGPSCFAACGIFPDQGSNPCPLHWQADSQPLRHQGSPNHFLMLDSSSSLFLHLMPGHYTVVHFGTTQSHTLRTQLGF